MVSDEISRFVAQGDFEAIVAAACLAHDIGNPPFGHFGERAIQDWANSHLTDDRYSDLTDAQRADLFQFEGNAQSFRVLTRLQMSNRRGGMRLTAATLGALIKYPRQSIAPEDSPFRKHGVCQDDVELFCEVFETAGRVADAAGQYARHPLALLSEAADDICYAIVDLEDGCKAGLIPIDDALGILEGFRENCTGSDSMPESDRLSMGRAIVINELVTQCAAVFRDSAADILKGNFRGALIKHIPAAVPYAWAKRVAFERVFNSRRVLELEATGYQAIQGLMNVLTEAALSPSPTAFDMHVRKIVNLNISDEMSAYQRLLACTDKVSGMTDRYCLELFQKLRPGQ